jgi:hypothetical protein
MEEVPGPLTSTHKPNCYETLRVAERRASETNSVLRNFRFWGFGRHESRIMKLSKRFGLHFSGFRQSTEHGVPYITTLRYQFH